MKRKKVTTNAGVKSTVKLVEKDKKIPVSKSETVINFLGDEPCFTIGTNNSTLMKKLFKVKPADSLMDEDRYGTWSFNIEEYNFNLIPKRKRKGRKPSPEQVQKMLAAKAK